MTPERWQQIKDIFDQAVECDPVARAAFLRERCGEDEDLKREVESLLASDPNTGSLLDNPLIETLTNVVGSFQGAAPVAAQSDSFGAYLPVRVLGEGGMGTVYLARQEYPIRREVALKVVKPGMDSHQVLERFESERQVLALMEHPNVARVLDAGTSERGRPYFVMEYVDGVSITMYCNRKALSTRERLQLFIPVCNALQHAHRKGIIHRDVKPSNVMVTELDGKPVPKVIDFGIARATDQRTAEGEFFTLAGQIMGTPEYMSPEQADPTGRDIDTGTDVYSLGVVLYELLVGALPMEPKSLRKVAFVEMLRAIRETPVPKPTARITQMGEAARALARQRGTDLAQFKRELAGDLDCIVMRAIEKDRHLRYASASEFGADIERYLRREPVLAGPPGAAYRMRKFVARHKGPVAAAAAVVLALIAGTITTVWQAHVAGQQRAEALDQKAVAERQRGLAEQLAVEAARGRDAAQAASVRAAAAEARAQQERNAALAEQRRADNEAATARAVNDFLQNDLLAQASAYSQARPGVEPDPDMKVRTALDHAAARIAGKFNGQPLIEVSIRLTIGAAYRRLGLYPEAQREMERARDLSRRALGETHPKTLEALRDLGELYLLQGNHSQAEPILTRNLELSRRVMGEEHPDTLVAVNDLGRLYTVQRKYAQAEPVLSQGLEVSRRVLGEYHPTTLEAMNNLAALSLRQRNYSRAEALFNRILAVCVRVWGEDHPDTLSTRANLGVLYLNQGKYGQAELELTRSLEVSRRVLGEGHPNTLEIMTGLIVSYRMQGKDTQAESMLARAVGIYERQGNSAGAEALRATDRANRPRAAREAFTTTGPTIDNRSGAGQSPGLSVRDPLLPPLLENRRNANNQALAKANSAWTQATAQLEQRNYAAAERLLREAAEYFDRSPDDWARYRNQSLLGESLTGQRKFAEAEPLLLAAYQGMTELQSTRRVYPLGAVEQARDRIVQLYLSWGKPERAEAWKAGAAK